MTKKYAKTAFVYAVLGLACGVFYREFTKYTGFEGFTSLSLTHVHYLMLGTVFFLVFALFEKAFAFSDKTIEKLVLVYHAGLNASSLGFLLRGLSQVLRGGTVGRGLDAAISGIAGAGHIALGISLLWILVKLIRGIKDEKTART